MEAVFLKRKEGDEVTIIPPNKPAGWAVWAAFGACVWAWVFAALSFYWALGGMVGVEAVSSAIVSLARARVPWLIVVLWLTGLLKIGSGLLVLALVQPWGRRMPEGLLLMLTWGAGTLFAVHGMLFFAVGALALIGVLHLGMPELLLQVYTFLWGPWFLLGGVLFLVVAYSVVRRTPQRRAGLLFSLVGVLGALVLLVLSGGTIG